MATLRACSQASRSGVSSFAGMFVGLGCGAVMLTWLCSRSGGSILLVGVWRLSQGQIRYEGWLETLRTPSAIALHCFMLIAMCYHAYTWWKVLPKTLPLIQIGGKPVPGVMLSSAVASGEAVFALSGGHAVPGPPRRPYMLSAQVAASTPLVRLSEAMHEVAHPLAPELSKPLRGEAHITLARGRSRGAVRYVDRPRQAGPRKYRLVVPRAGARPKATSAPVARTAAAAGSGETVSDTGGQR